MSTLLKRKLYEDLFDPFANLHFRNNFVEKGYPDWKTLETLPIYCNGIFYKGLLFKKMHAGKNSICILVRQRADGTILNENCWLTPAEFQKEAGVKSDDYLKIIKHDGMPLVNTLGRRCKRKISETKILEMEQKKKKKQRKDQPRIFDLSDKTNNQTQYVWEVQLPQINPSENVFTKNWIQEDEKRFQTFRAKKEQLEKQRKKYQASKKKDKTQREEKEARNKEQAQKEKQIQKEMQSNWEKQRQQELKLQLKTQERELQKQHQQEMEALRKELDEEHQREMKRLLDDDIQFQIVKKYCEGNEKTSSCEFCHQDLFTKQHRELHFLLFHQESLPEILGCWVCDLWIKKTEMKYHYSKHFDMKKLEDFLFEQFDSAISICHS